METNEEIRRAFQAVVDEAYRVSAETGREVEDSLRLGLEHPLTAEEARQLLDHVVSTLRDGACRRGDSAATEKLAGDVSAIVDRILATREQPGNAMRPSSAPVQLQLVERNGIKPVPVRPKPVFHGREVPMTSGFVPTSDMRLWDRNERLDIHLAQFRAVQGREPTSEELLDIMLSKMSLPGIPKDEKEDQFAIVELARSISINGVQKPPILDVDGTLLDGNRRVAACNYILHSDEFDTDQKQRVEYVFVWQLTEHTTDDERRAVVVALNFESDCKQPWPEYVKAKKVAEEWQGMLALEQRNPGPQRQAEMKRALSMRFALGPETSVVNRYIKMVDWADEFEDFLVHERQRDAHEVKHRANRYFQYFDELAKGTRPGGVAWSLNQDDAFKKLVFDLLYDGKFSNWRQIRELRHIYNNQEAREILSKARQEPDPAEADEHMENAIAIGRSSQAEQREVGANTRIETFVKWLEELPVRAFRDAIKPENLKRLLKALHLVEKYAASAKS